MIVLRALLFPFSILYDLATRFRNHLYYIGHKKSFRFETMVISVGNLNVGGSGKTPMIEYLAKLLSPRHKIATLSRGYGRKTRGLHFATEADSADTIGDEPYQFFRKFGHEVMVTVSEDRAFAIPNMLQRLPTPEVILLDDAFQHRSVKPQLSILLTDYSFPFYKDFVLPTGNLRESRVGAKRSDIVVVTKSEPKTSHAEFVMIKKEIRHYAPGVPVFFTSLEYGSPVSFGSEPQPSSEIVLVTGIANSKSIKEYVSSRFKVLRHFRYRDHHCYALSEILAIQDFCLLMERPVSIMTTEKDMVKLIGPDLKAVIGSSPWFYLPIRISFLKNGSDFDRFVLHAIEMAQQNT